MMENITLKEWLRQTHTKEEYQELFLNMDMTMHYIHDQGYGIISSRGFDGSPEFDINHIQIIQSKDRQNILFQDIDQIQPEYQKEIVRQNIYSMAYLAIKSYANFNDRLNHHFLKEHFDEFTVFLPEEDIPYYRGVIVNKARVYYASYIEERTKRMIQQEGENLSTSSQQRGNRLTKSTDVGRFYSQLEDHDGNAFIRLYIFPAIIVSLSLIIPLIAWVFALL